MSGIFKAYDIRGLYPEELNEDLARKIGRSFVKLLNAKNIVVGQDMRLSSPSLSSAFIRGASEMGAQVTDIGLSTTPMLYYAIWSGTYDGGAIVTASHLGGQSNGFKLCREKAIPLSGDNGIPEIERMVREDKLLPDTVKGSVIQQRILDQYVDTLSMFVINPRPLKIVVDPGNGTAGPEIYKLFEGFPMWQLIPMYMEPDGSFPNHIANPFLPNTTKDLKERVIKEKADIGVAFDGDADRCGFIDEKGEKIPEDLVNALIGEFFAMRSASDATILYDIRSSRIVPETLQKLNATTFKSRVGHAFIKTAMREVNAIFAGELSGHYYFRDMGFTDNAVFAMIQMLNLISLKKKPLSELIQPLRKYSNTGEINIKVKDKDKIFNLIEQKYKDSKIDHLDGLTIEYDPWWFNLRASNTESVIRLNLEAGDIETMEEKKNEVLSLISYIDPDMHVEKE